MVKFTRDEAVRRLGEGDFVRLLDQSAFDVSLYRPEQLDKQKPHLRDELYVIASGSGDFVCDGKTDAFAPGDLFYVPAGVEHGFVKFTANFATWVVFFGPRPSSAS